MTSEVGMYLFRAANVWWRCAQYYVIDSCVYMWYMFVFMSVVVTVCGNVCCLADIVEDSVFLALECLCRGCD